MKTDLDKLMKKHNVDAIFIIGAAQHNPSMVYFVGTAHVSDAILIKQRGKDAVLFHYPMEREEAAKSGLKLVSMTKYPLHDLLKQAGGNYLEAFVLRLKLMLEEMKLTRGRVALYGKDDIGPFYSILNRLQELMPELQFAGFVRDEILMNAMMTKDAGEIEHIRAMGRVTTDVVAKTADYITGHKTKGGVVVHKDGTPVTIGEVKNLIQLWLAERGAENPEGTIFAIGRDAGIPHSVGNPSDALQLGQTIVYDIYPCEAGGGYYYDFTRTWCLGYADDETTRLHQEVLKVYHTIINELKVNKPLKDYQIRTCQLFSEMGHQTVADKFNLTEGYVHSVSHGLGLDVHENPFSGFTASDHDILIPGVVFSVEPGLYYPSKGTGVRIEDSVYLNPDGKFEILADYPYDLVLPVKK